MREFLKQIKKHERPIKTWFALAILTSTILAFYSIDGDEVRAEQAKRVEAYEAEAKRELDCVLSGGKWKHVTRHGFVCAPMPK